MKNENDNEFGIEIDRGLLHRFLLLTSHPGFKIELKKCRREFSIPESGFTQERVSESNWKKLEDQLESHWYIHLAKLAEEKDGVINEWADSIDDICRRYDFSIILSKYIANYVKFGKFFFEGNKIKTYRINCKYPRDTKTPVVTIEIFAPLKDAEKKLAMKEAHAALRNLHTKQHRNYQPITNIFEYLEIEHLTEKKGGDGIKTDRDIGADVFFKEDPKKNTSLKEQKKEYRKLALKVGKGRQRLNEQLKDKFPDDTFPS